MLRQVWTDRRTSYTDRQTDRQTYRDRQTFIERQRDINIKTERQSKNGETGQKELYQKKLKIKMLKDR